MASNSQLFNQMLFKRADLEIYLEKILLKLKSNKTLIIHLYADDLRYLVFNLCESNETELILPNLNCLAHKQLIGTIIEFDMLKIITTIRKNLDLNSIAISCADKAFQIKWVLSSTVKLTEFSQKELTSKDSQFCREYHKDNCTCAVCSITWDCIKISSTNQFWKSFKLSNSVSRTIFYVQQELKLDELKCCEPLHKIRLPFIDIKSRFGLKKLHLYNKSICCVYLKTCQFSIKTNAGCYLVDIISPNIGIVGHNILKALRRGNDKVIIKSNFIAGEHFKVKLNIDDIEDDINKVIDSFMTDENDCCVVANISDIYKIGLRKLNSMRYFMRLPKLETFEIIIDQDISERKNVIHMLNEIPIKFNLLININKDSEWILHDSDFWHFIIAFTNVDIFEIFQFNIKRIYKQRINLEMFERECISTLKEDLPSFQRTIYLNRLLQKLILSNWLN